MSSTYAPEAEKEVKDHTPETEKEVRDNEVPNEGASGRSPETALEEGNEKAETK